MSAKAPSVEPDRLGEVIHWPGGFAMSLGYSRRGGGVARCCSGHPTPEDAKNHGLARLMEIAIAVAHRDIAEWASKAAS